MANTDLWIKPVLDGLNMTPTKAMTTCLVETRLERINRSDTPSTDGHLSRVDHVHP